MLRIAIIMMNVVYTPFAHEVHRTQEFMDAVRWVESKDGQYLVGQDGEIGPYQIQRGYWQDATEYASLRSRQHWSYHRGLHEIYRGHGYDSLMNDRAYGEVVMGWYWMRYATDKRPEVLARMHNGGPRGHTKRSTEAYWSLVKRRLGPHFDWGRQIGVEAWLVNHWMTNELYGRRADIE